MTPVQWLKNYKLFLCVMLIIFVSGASSSQAQGNLEPITAQNARQLAQLDLISRGRVEDMDWSPDGRWLAITTSIGVWLQDMDQLQDEPVLLRVLDEPQTIAFSAESDMIAVAGCQGRVPEVYFPGVPVPCAISETRVWRLDDLTAPPDIIPNGATNIMSLHFAPGSFRNGPLLVAHQQDAIIRLWNGGRVWTLDFSHEFRGVASRSFFSPDKSTLAVLGSTHHSYYGLRKTVFLVGTNRFASIPSEFVDEIPTIIIPDEVLTDTMSFSEDGQALMGRSDGGLWRWDLSQPDMEPVYEARLVIPETLDTRAMPHISPDFRRAITREDDENRLWIDAQHVFDPTPPEDSYVILPSDERLDYRGFSADSRFLLTGTRVNYDFETEAVIPGILSLYDAATGEQVAELGIGSGYGTIRYVLSPDSVRIVYLDSAYRVIVHDIAEDRELFALDGFATETYGVGVRPDGTLIYSSCAMYIATGSQASCLPASLHIGERVYPEISYLTADISPDGETLVDRKLALRDGQTGELLQTLELLGRDDLPRIWHLDFSPNGDWLAVTGGDPLLAPLNDTGQEPIALEIPLSPEGYGTWTPGIAFHPDGGLVATISYDGKARLWDAATGELLSTLISWPALLNEDPIGSTSGDGIAFSPDGSLLAFGSCHDIAHYGGDSVCFDARVYVWDVAQALAGGEQQPDQARLILAGAWDFTVDLIFSPDGGLIVAASSPRGWESAAGEEVTVWSSQSGELLAVLQAYGATEVAFSPDGLILYSNSADGVVYRWGVAAGN